MLEIAGLIANIILAVKLRQSWEPLDQDMEELQTLRRLLVAGESGTGLLPRQVAELRLVEEVDRARQFRRPLGLLLVDIEDLAKSPAHQLQALEAHQALVRQLASTSLVHDIPFRMGPNQVGLILPERDWDGLYQDAESIINALKGAVFVDAEGRSHQVLHLVGLNFGLATYQGETSGTIDLMGAAQDSLSVSRDLAGIGETSVSAYAMPATPIVGAQAFTADEEE
jgi:GGDEF domain-containing protein